MGKLTMITWKLYKDTKPELKEHSEYEGIYQSDLVLVYNKSHGILLGRFMKSKTNGLHFHCRPSSVFHENMRPSHWMYAKIPTE